MNSDGHCSDVVLEEAWSRYTVSSSRCEAGCADAGRLGFSHHRTKEGRREVNPSRLTTPTSSLAPLSPQADRQRWQSLMNRVSGHVKGIKYNYWGVFSQVSHSSPKIPWQQFFCSLLLKIKMTRLSYSKGPSSLLRDKGEWKGGINVRVPNNHKKKKKKSLESP